MSKFYKISEHTLTNIADAMRMWTNKTDKITPDEMPQEVDALFNAGADIGYNTGYDHGKREGGKEALAEFMHHYQNYEIPENCDYRFAGAGWNVNTFKPTQSMKPTSATGMFRRNRFNGDMVTLFQELGISLDFSECAQMTYAFYECSATRLGVIDFTATVSTSFAFGYMYNCQIIDLVKLKAENTFSAASFRCPALVEIRIQGVIGQNGFDIHWSTELSKASLISIVNAASSTASITIKLPSAAVKREFETSAGANDGNTSQEWKDLIATRPTVTFALS